MRKQSQQKVKHCQPSVGTLAVPTWFSHTTGFCFFLNFNFTSTWSLFFLELTKTSPQHKVLPCCMDHSQSPTHCLAGHLNPSTCWPLLILTPSSCWPWSDIHAGSSRLSSQEGCEYHMSDILTEQFLGKCLSERSKPIRCLEKWMKAFPKNLLCFLTNFREKCSLPWSVGQSLRRTDMASWGQGYIEREGNPVEVQFKNTSINCGGPISSDFTLKSLHCSLHLRRGTEWAVSQDLLGSLLSLCSL